MDGKEMQEILAEEGRKAGARYEKAFEAETPRSLALSKAAIQCLMNDFPEVYKRIKQVEERYPFIIWEARVREMVMHLIRQIENPRRGLMTAQARWTVLYQVILLDGQTGKVQFERKDIRLIKHLLKETYALIELWGGKLPAPPPVKAHGQSHATSKVETRRKSSRESNKDTLLLFNKLSIKDLA